MKTEEKPQLKVGQAVLEACTSALDFLSRDGGELNSRARPIIKALREAKLELESGVIKVEQPAKDKADIQFDDTNPENPRVIANIPAGQGFWELLDGQGKVPSYVIVVARPEKPGPAIECLGDAMHAVHIYRDMKTIRQMRLTAGVGEAAAPGLVKV